MRASGRAARLGVAGLGLVPFAALVVGAVRDQLGADPVETLQNETGQWALRLLLATLAVTPARRWLGFAWLAPHRRTLGLLAYFYACLHFSTYLGFDLALDFGALAEDVIERPFITVGFTTLLLLTPLAATSTRRAIRRLGRRWTSLHRLIYPAVVTALVHFVWSVKADRVEPLIYASLAAVLLALRWRGPLRRGAAAGRNPASCASLPRPTSRGAARTGVADRERESAS